MYVFLPYMFSYFCSFYLLSVCSLWWLHSLISSLMKMRRIRKRHLTRSSLSQFTRTLLRPTKKLWDSSSVSQWWAICLIASCLKVLRV
jgi:hypothetical protein